MIRNLLSKLSLPVLFIIATLLIVITTIFAMLLWNALMPSIFGLPEITFWQTLGLWLLIKYFFSQTK